MVKIFDYSIDTDFLINHKTTDFVHDFAQFLYRGKKIINECQKSPLLLGLVHIVSKLIINR